MSASLNDTIFGPLGAQFCLYFYVLSLIGFVFMVLALLGVIGLLFTKKFDSRLVIGALGGAATYAIIYFQNRLLYNMCNRSEAAIAAVVK